MRQSLSEDKDFYRLSKFDVVIIALVIIFSSFSIAWLNSPTFQGPKASGTAYIYQNNRLLEKVSLAKDGMFALADGRMQIEVSKGKIRVAKSDCPQHICMHTGWVQHGGQAIVCVPNKVLIEIKSGGFALIDAVAN